MDRKTKQTIAKQLLSKKDSELKAQLSSICVKHGIKVAKKYDFVKEIIPAIKDYLTKTAFPIDLSNEFFEELSKYAYTGLVLLKSSLVGHVQIPNNYEYTIDKCIETLCSVYRSYPKHIIDYIDNSRPYSKKSFAQELEDALRERKGAELEHILLNLYGICVQGKQKIKRTKHTFKTIYPKNNFSGRPGDADELALCSSIAIAYTYFNKTGNLPYRNYDGSPFELLINDIFLLLTIDINANHIIRKHAKFMRPCQAGVNKNGQ